MEKITYFTGAGASYHCLPLIRDMSQRMTVFSRFLKQEQEKKFINHNFLSKYIEELDELIAISQRRTSIDAYARELTLSNEGNASTKLIRLKALLSGYMIFEQLIKPKHLTFFSEEMEYDVMPTQYVPLDEELQEKIHVHFDKRYITFWGDYLYPKVDLPKSKLRIISWNYDMQFEATYSNLKQYSLDLVQERLQVFPSCINNIDHNTFCILKLNGTAGLINDKVRDKSFNAFDLKEENFIRQLEMIVTLYEGNYTLRNHHSNSPLFSFAWENDISVAQTRKIASEIIKDTTILVIIGYSFPTFNKTIDRQIFADISGINKIYYQAPREDMPELLAKLDGINSNMKKLVVPITNLETFYVPVEH